MRVIEYIPNSIVDGTGIRQVFYLAGCKHKCEQCHNPQTWDMNGGKNISIDRIAQMALISPYNITFSGGDPLYQAKELKLLLAKIKPYKTIWVYTGFTWEEIMEDEELKSVIPYIDVLVDGRFDYTKKDLTLLFRGSSNQRIIDCKKSLDKGEVVLWEIKN